MLPARGFNMTLQVVGRRSFQTSAPAKASILFALGALSNSRETQHFNKLTRLPRIEHSPPLKLIQTSEVLPYPLPTPPKPAPRSNAWDFGRPKTALRVWDDKALQVGRVFLTDQARHTHRLRQSLGRAKRRYQRQDALTKQEKLVWQHERVKLQKEMRAAGAWILVSIGTATALATWRFWPEPRTDSGDLSRKLAARAAAAMPLPAAIQSEPVMPVPTPLASAIVSAHPGKAVLVQPTVPVDAEKPLSSSSWWKSLFWKQQ